jgi:DNA helicase-2/ATP-dependent DNA helicase PcrA
VSVEHLVIGPPGTGKTTFLARQSIAAAEKVGAESVMIASLTRAAASEIAGRRTPIPRECVGTLHAHAFRALDKPELAETAEGLASWNEYASEEEHAFWKIGGGSSMNLDYAPEQRAEGQGEKLLAQMGTLRAMQAPREGWPRKVTRFSEAWDGWKKKSGRLDFTDLIERALEEIDRPMTMPKIMMLDEAQDLSALEMALARKWAETCEQIVVVGDPDQALYTWRGADPAAMVGSDLASSRVLAQSYRVPAAVHEYAVNWIEGMSGREPVEYMPRFEDPRDESKGHAKGEVTRAPGTFREPEGVVRRILADVDAGKSVMLLASCGYMLDPAIAVLRQKGIPFHNPYRVDHGGWNPLAGARRLLSFLRPDYETWGDETRFYTWVDVRAWAEELRAKGILDRGAKDFLVSKARDEKERERKGEEGEGPISLRSLSELLASEDVLERVFDMDVAWWHDSLLPKAQKSARYPVTIYNTLGGASLRETPKLVIGTIHSVKGGEADSVYVFPDLSHRGWATGWENLDSRAPTYRLFYVAFTRAREKLTICEPAFAGEAATLPAPESAATGKARS